MVSDMNWDVTIIVLFIAVGGMPGMVCGESIDIEEMLAGGQEWIVENVDQDYLERFQAVDTDEIQRFWREIQGRFHGEYVVDCANLRGPAELILEALSHIDGARPYGIWLKTRLDYFEVADELRVIVPPPAQHPEKRPKPSAALQRRVWHKKIENKPLPTGANHYVPRLKPIFAATGIPPELVWLAEVESSFDPTARSPVGAAGLFQFMPRTAKHCGLSLKPVDQRLDPEKSARAAANYLKYLHGRFHSWPLALAAYNAGEGRVSGLLKKSGGHRFDDIATSLPAETQLYVPKIEAVLAVRENVELKHL